MRFPEFKGKWEVKKLGEVTSKINSGKTPLGGDAVYTNEGILFIRSQNVNNDKLELENPVFIPEEINKGMKNSIVHPNDILLNITGASLGRSCVVPEEFNIGNVNQHVCIIRTNTGYNSRFIQPILSSTKGQNVFKSLQTGSGREGLNFESIKNIKINFPTIFEQQKIATFLSLMDDKIQTQNKIIGELKVLKNSISKKIFTQQLRFKDENGNDFPDWEVKKLGDVLNIQGGYAFKSNSFNQGTTKVIRIGDIYPTIKLADFSGVFSFEIPNEKYIVKKNDFVMALSGATFGKVGKIIDEGLAYINQRVAAFRTKQCLEFYYQLVQTENFKSYINSIPTASAQPNISNDDIANYKTLIPNIVEQKRVANFLSSIDHKIEVENLLLNKLQTQKQYLLSNLFI
ncbi:restriction endonuclease subunit S [Flavobacterium magnesitis]|uniref:restriction endonuclease subunit S n=1 Tax=Flavobacterium magnesitis TaxID=3138077 RepID=UPI00358FB1A8